MKPWPPFHLVETPLTAGTTLIEASAGTGKTFTIAGLFLRLILERNFSVREILVVTFTEAATGELRDRIRKTLAAAAAAFRVGRADDPLMAGLLAAHRAQTAAMLERLDRALSGFDEAAIFTIHGFCQRTLRDRAFESGTLFDTELLTDDSALLRDIADDYWRTRFYDAVPFIAALALKNRLDPDALLPLLRVHNRHPFLKIISRVDDRSLESVELDLRTNFNALRELWKVDRTAIHGIFERADWAIGDYAKPEIVLTQLALLERCLSTETPDPEALAALKFFSTAEISEGTSKRATSPVHRLFTLCDELMEHERDYLDGLRIDFLSVAKTLLPQRKQQLKVQSFDDLLTRLHAALLSPAGEDLSREVRSRYRAALIDEFQDTDPVQYQIFHRLFALRNIDAATHATPLLFLIGDPKQAIYGFRGADIFTYLEAAASVHDGYTLTQNWRSETRLVRAVNAVFSLVDAPFVFEDIGFQPVTAAGKADTEPLTEAGRALPALHLWFMPRSNGASTITKDDAEARLPQQVGAEITRLLNDPAALIGTRHITPRDIAVLVPENRQARLMQEALRLLNVPSVLHTEESVFASLEAREFSRILAALAQPGRERLLKTALATDLLGFDGASIEELIRDERRWETRLARFHQHHDCWLTRGFTAMFRQWLHDEEVRQHLLKLTDGERRLTNLLHIAELLHRAAQERRLGPTALGRWLAEQTARADRPAEEHQIRLERDDQAVRLVTIHKSKGLEYPIVFCPFSWKSSDIKRGGREEVFFHQETVDENGGKASEFIHDLGSADYAAHRQAAIREKLAENLRLLYVALTRARNRCYFVWGGFKNAGTAAASWLFHQPATLNADLKQSLDDHFKQLDDARLLSDLQRLTDPPTVPGELPSVQITRVEDHPAAPYRPPADAAPDPEPRRFTGAIARDWRITSFSTLAAGHRDERPDHDRVEPELIASAEPESEPSGIFAFPRGSTPGTCLHKIFEELDFTLADTEALPKLVTHQLQVHGFASREFMPAVCDAIRRTLVVPLDPACPGLLLNRVPRSERLDELEFFFPVAQLSPALLENGFAGFARSPDFAAQLGRLGFKPAAGFVKGFIDLVFRSGERFYLVDWKSNWLGARAEDYGPAAMSAEMARKYYYLQYHLYTVALHQYLALRVPDYDYDRHFGGVFYLFLRGIDPARPELGVHRDRPNREWVESFSASLRREQEVATP